MIPVFDPSGLSYEEWLRYFFDRPIMEFSEWYAEGSFQVDNEVTLLTYLQRFNIEFALLQKRFSIEQLDQGLWVLYGPAIHTGSHFISENVPLDLRLDAIASLEPLYLQAVKGWTGDIGETDSVFFMLWDLLLREMYYESEYRGRPPAGFDAILDKCAETLGRILELDDKACEVCALHGLGHLKTSSARALIHRYLEQHPDMPDAERVWGESCHRGEML
jgi:hypothetical protein